MKDKRMSVRKFLIGGFLAVAWLVGAAGAAEKEDWEICECKLQTDQYYDGDSFYAEDKEGKTLVFRLYGVDCPETDDRFPDRIKEQAEHFGIPEKDVLRWGEKAKDFTKKFLRSGFEVQTLKEETYSSGGAPRYFAIVLKGKERLAEALVEAGLARAYGKPVHWPPRGRGDMWTFMKDLKEIEARAKRKKVGMWGE